MLQTNETPGRGEPAEGSKEQSHAAPSISENSAPVKHGWKDWFGQYGGDNTAPVVPHNAVSPTLHKKVRGKCLGYQKPNGEWVGLTGPMSERRTTREQAIAAHRTGAGVGLLGREFGAFDADSSIKALVDEAAELAETILGPAPIRGRPNSPRKLLLFRAKGTRKRRIAFLRPDQKPGDKPDAFEWLGDGQYWNVEGVHPSGVAYQWTEPHPCDLGPAGLSETNADGVSILFEALPALLARHGCTIVKQTASSGNLANGRNKPLSDPTLWHPSGPKPVLEALAADPDDYDYDDWVTHAHAYKAALGPDREDHYGAFEDWSLQHPECTPEAARKVWDSIETSRIGHEFLRYPAEVEFVDHPEAEADDLPPDPGDAAKNRMCSENIYLASLDRFLHIPTGTKRKPKAFNAAYTDSGQFGSRLMAEAAFLNDPKRGRRYDSVTYRPGKGLIVRETDRETGVSTEMVNLWKPSTLEPKAATDADVAPFLKHVAMHLPKEESDKLLDWMAFVVQRPGEKVNYIVAVVGEAEGTGKDAMFEPLRRIVGEHNAATVNGTALRREFNAKYLQKQIVIFNEVQGLTPAEMNQIKELGAAPPHTLWVNEKNSPEYPIPNIINCVMLSNHLDALALGKHDRRYLILHSRVENVPSEEYFKTLWGWFEGDGCAKVYGWLKARDISAFNPNKPAAMTTLKAQMIRNAEPAPVRWCRNLFREGGAFDGRTIVAMGEITQRRTAPRDVTHMTARAALVSEGFVTNDRLQVRVGKEGVKRLWIRDPGGLLAQLGPAQLSERYLAEKAEHDRHGGGDCEEDFA
jgi:hypothetical protein